MRKYLLFIYLIFVSCSQTYIEETQDAVSINTRVSYNTSDTGVLIEWDTQWDFARVEIFKGTEANRLSVHKDNLAQNTWLDEETIPGEEYYYRLGAYNSKNRMIGQSDVYKGLRSYRPYDQIVIPSNLKTDFAEYTDKIEIYWIGNESDVFRIYRSTDPNAILVEIAEMSFNSSEELKYSDHNIEQGINYFYKVSTVGKKADGTVAVKMSEGLPLEGVTKIAPKGIKTTTILGGVELTWDDDGISEYYQIYRSETEIEDDYELVVPFVKEEKYTDKNLPNVEGFDVGGTYTYPLYYYKIKAFSKGQESRLSDPVTGFAINPADYLSAPENFNVAIDKSVYPYRLNISWTLVKNNGVAYRLSKIDNGETNLIVETPLLTYTIPNEEFNTSWDYIVQTINNDAGGLPGRMASKNYTSLTPAPPDILTVSEGARIVSTNFMNDTPKNTHVYFKWISWGRWKYGNRVIGSIQKEWVTKSTVGHIDLTWDKQEPSEFVTYYTIYRKKQGEMTEFIKIANVDTLVYSDKGFTPEEYTGSGTGDTFKYPLYEYQITATFGGEESAPSSILAGSAINPNDILPAPSYVTIPGFWSNGSAWDDVGGVKRYWLDGQNAPDGAEKLELADASGYQDMYLTWGDVANATYRVRHFRGFEPQETDWYNHGNKSGTFQKFNNKTGDDSYTGMFVLLDGVWGYTKNNASFEVGSVNENAGNQLGEVRGIWFDEPNESPY